MGVCSQISDNFKICMKPIQYWGCSHEFSRKGLNYQTSHHVPLPSEQKLPQNQMRRFTELENAVISPMGLNIDPFFSLDPLLYIIIRREALNLFL